VKDKGDAMATVDFDLLTELGHVSRKAVAAPLPREHRQAAKELEDLIAILNFQLSRIDSACERWSAAISQNAIGFDWEDSRTLSVLYQGWLETAEAVAPRVDDWIVRFGALQGVDEFFLNLRRIRLMSLDTERSMRSIDSFGQGRETSIDRAMEELRNTLPTPMLPPPVASPAAPSHATGSGFHTRIVMGVAVAGAGVIGGVFYGALWALDTARLW
jgi:hypothetical protein